MDRIDLSKMDEQDLLRLYGDIIEVLRGKEIIRTSNVTAEYGEYYVIHKLNLTRENVGNKSYDAINEDGKKYQIKCRRWHQRNKDPHNIGRDLPPKNRSSYNVSHWIEKGANEQENIHTGTDHPQAS